MIKIQSTVYFGEKLTLNQWWIYIHHETNKFKKSNQNLNKNEN